MKPQPKPGLVEEFRVYAKLRAIGDPDEAYVYTDPFNCAYAQFVKSRRGWLSRLFMRPIAYIEPPVLRDAIIDLPWTWGALARRLDEEGQ